MRRLVLAASAHAQAQLRGAITEVGEISLADATGGPVSHLTPGTYAFEVVDTATIHNFHLVGTSVQTPIEGTGTFAFPSVPLEAGDYVYQCDAHPEVNGSFSVGAAPPPDAGAGAPASVVRVAVRKARGVRTVAVSARVTRSTTAWMKLVRRGRVAAASAEQPLAPGARALKLRVPRRAPAGVYSLRVTFRDPATGRKFVVRRTVRLPR